MKPYRGAAAWAAWAVVCSLAAAQTRVDLRTQSKAVDFSQANSTRPFKTGTTLPATCTAGEAFFKTDAPAGQNLYGCTAANVWTPEGGGAGMAAQLGDFAVTRTSGSVLTIGSNCSSAMPCNVRTGGVVRTFTAPATATLSAGSGTAYVYVDSAGTLTVGHNLGLTCSGCTAASGVTAFPAQSVPLFTWAATSGMWDAAGGSDRRAFLSDRAVAGGTGIVTTEAGGPTVVAVDPATVPLYSTGTTLPGTCAVGEQFIKTDAPAGQRIYFCTAANTWTQPSGSGLPVTLSATAPLSGGGSLDQNRTVACATCATSAAALGANAIVKGGGGQALAASGASIDSNHNISTPGSIATGVGTGASGKLSLSGASSGTVDVTVNSAAGTWTMTLPAGAGSDGQPLITDGSGGTSFATLGASGGGTGLTAAGDDEVMVGNGTAWQSKTMPDCPDTGGNHLNYIAGSNSFACGTSGGAGGGATTALSNLSAVAINTALLPATAAGSDFGAASLPWARLYLAGDSGSPASNYFRITGTSTGGVRTVTLADADSVTVQPSGVVGHQFLTGIGSNGVVARAQPSAADLTEGTTGSGAVVLAGAPTLTGPVLQSYTVATLPAAAANKVVIVTDGDGVSCTSGGGSTRVLCHYNGTAWVPLGDGNSGAAPSFADITAGSNAAALVITTGGSLGVSGSGTISATSVGNHSFTGASTPHTYTLPDSDKTLAPTADPVFTGSVQLPNGASPSLDAAGEVAIDTTTDQLQFYGATKRALPSLQWFSFSIAAPANTDDINVLKAPYGMTIVAIHGIVQGSTSVTGQLQECDSTGASCTDLDSDIVIDADGANDDGSLTDPDIASGNWIRWKTTSVSGTPTFLTVTVTFRVVAD